MESESEVENFLDVISWREIEDLDDAVISISMFSTLMHARSLLLPLYNWVA